MKTPLIVAALVAVASTASAQSKLDATVTRIPTVRTELARGNDAAFQCGLDNIGRFMRIDKCILSALSTNKQRQTLSDAFQLGFVFDSAYGVG
jgi:hypothetical protein